MGYNERVDLGGGWPKRTRSLIILLKRGRLEPSSKKTIEELGSPLRPREERDRNQLD